MPVKLKELTALRNDAQINKMYISSRVVHLDILALTHSKKSSLCRPENMNILFMQLHSAKCC